MIAEIPGPACAQGSRVRAQMARARAAFIQRFGMPSTTHFARIPGSPLATVTGVLFFDEIHGQKGVAPKTTRRFTDAPNAPRGGAGHRAAASGSDMI